MRKLEPVEESADGHGLWSAESLVLQIQVVYHGGDPLDGCTPDSKYGA